MESSVNRSNVLTQIHACYDVDESNVLRSRLSATCFLFHVFFSSLSVITVCGNLLVITSIIYFKQLHTPTNTLILSLAVTDLLVGVIVFPLNIEFSAGVCHYHNYLFCQVRGFFEVSLCTASVLNLCCIAVDRYCAICHPLTYKTTINENVVGVMILVSWGLPILIGVGLIIAKTSKQHCASACQTTSAIGRGVGFVLAFYLPAIIMVFIYLKIFCAAKRQARSIHSMSGGTVTKLERKATKTLSIVMGAFLMCWLPFYLCLAVISLNHVYIPTAVFEMFVWLALSNSMLNPFIYAFYYKWFRSAIRMIISGKIIQADLTKSRLF